MAWLKLPEQASLRRSFAEFFRQILERRIKPQTPIGELHDLREVDSTGTSCVPGSSRSM
jgi:hypothetical protein